MQHLRQPVDEVIDFLEIFVAQPSLEPPAPQVAPRSFQLNIIPTHRPLKLAQAQAERPGHDPADRSPHARPIRDPWRPAFERIDRPDMPPYLSAFHLAHEP